MNFLGKKILESVREKKTCICGFDTFNMESAQAVARVAAEMSVPVFLQACSKSAHYMGLEMALRILQEAKRTVGDLVCIHFDHGEQLSCVEELKQAIRLGFESIMVDGSSLTLQDNIALCRKIAEMAHPEGICVEGEIGKVSRNINATREELNRLMTDPEQAGRLVEESGIDYLAISVGSVSGFYRKEVVLDLERLEQIREKVSVPLVLHGGTSIPLSQVREAIRLGVAKINIAHGLRTAFLDGMR
ncbi:MAG: class II fructose-bisphosphate aldolase [Candidatus Omnitrophica bacterium]|nr:class II fructose-bisphosphate aldolase [Candidatus Omnitrophota bacterium]